MAEEVLNLTPAETAEKTETGKKPGRIWRRFLLVWAVFLLLLGLIGCFLLYQFLTVYEFTRPEILMDELTSVMSADDWLDKAAENLEFTLTEYEDPQALYAEYRKSLTTDQPLSYRSERRESDADHAVFVIRCGPSNLCTAELVPVGGRLPFGRHRWKLGSVGSGDITKQLRSAKLSVTALEAQDIALNGLSLGEDAVAEDAMEIKSLSEIEKRMDTVPTMLRYEVGPLYGEIHVTADGAELAPAEKKGRTLRYDAVPEGGNSLVIHAPEDIRVTVGGAELKRKDAESSGYGLLEGLEKYLGDAMFQTLVYRFDGLLTQPEVKAFARDGTELRPIMIGEENYAFFHPTDKESEELAHVRELAEGYFDTYVDYTSKPFDGGAYYKLLNSTLGGTALQVYIAQSNAAMKWAASSTMEQRLHYDNFHMIGDSGFTCTVEFEVDKTSSTWVEEVSSTESNAGQLVFIRQGKFWFAAALSMITD